MAVIFRKFVATVVATLVVFTASATTLQKQNQDEKRSEDRGLSPTYPDVYELSQGGMLCVEPKETCTRNSKCCPDSTCKKVSNDSDEWKCACNDNYREVNTVCVEIMAGARGAPTPAPFSMQKFFTRSVVPSVIPSGDPSGLPTGIPSGALSGPPPSSKPSCENSSGYLYEEVEEQNCEWAADNPKKRCKFKDSTRENQKLSVFCPFECDLRCGCRNHKKPFSLEGKKKKCKSVNESDCMKEAGRGGKKIVADFCPKKCNTCYSR